MSNHIKNLSYKVRGDILVVQLKDASLTPYFKGQAHINNKKEMFKLMNELKEKGVSFPTSWF